jgi:RHS repeat-associated protein
LLATISEYKIEVSSNCSVEFYTAEVLSQNDYYPFGMMISGRKFSLGDYRYGFNRKENDNEVKGEGNQLDYGMRIYDPRVARFLSVDPISKSYPMLTPYQFASNTPIQAIDLDGLEAFYVHGTWSNPNTFSKLTVSTINEITGNNTGAEFKWSGYNTNKARRKAAIELANHITKNRDNNQPLTIVGHSHGGNVSIMAANILKKRGIKVNNVITINTPVREYQLDAGTVDKHVNIYQHYDPVQASGGNKVNIPDNVTIVRPGIFIPTSFEGSKKGTGEVGSAGRTFDDATNIPEPFDRTHIHDSHNTPELWKTILNDVINPPPITPIGLDTRIPQVAKDNTNVVQKKIIKP